MRTRLNLDAQIALPHDDVRAHRNPANADKFLSATAIRNLEKWYALDIEIYQWCLQKRVELLS